MNQKKIFYNNLYMLRKIIKYCPSQLAVSVFSALLGSAVSVLNILILKYIINSITNRESLSYTILLICLTAVISIFQVILNSFFSSVVVPRNTQILQQKMQMDMFQKAIDVELKCYEDAEFYNKYSMALQQSDSRALSVLQTFTTLLASFFSISALLTLIVTLEPPVLIAIFISVTISFLLNIKYIKHQHEYTKENIPIYREMGYIKRVFYLADYAKELRYYEIPDVLKKIFENATVKAIRLIRTYGFKFAFLTILRETSATLGNLWVMIYLAYNVFDGRISIGDFTALASSSQQLSSQILSFLGTFPRIYEHSLYIDHYREFIEYQPQILNNENGLNIPKDADLRIDNISFRYSETRGEVLKNINIQIRHKEKVAFVGHNGSGKTTLVKLITRLYDPAAGGFFINDKPYADYKLKDLRGHIGVLFQDYHYFALTIAENVLMRNIKPERREEDERIVLNALKVCGLYEKVIRFPDGIYTALSREFNNDGVFLSGGELQKLALARIYAKECSIVILDEPSSSLDPIAENALFEAMLETGKDKTVIMISHRLANVKNVDRIYLFENGKIIESGSHQELMQLGKKYAAMFQLQAKQYTNEDNTI